MIELLNIFILKDPIALDADLGLPEPDVSENMIFKHADKTKWMFYDLHVSNLLCFQPACQ